LWNLKGEVTDDRITNGEVICPNDHVWIVKEEILRFDTEKSDEPMEFLDHPRTGFPKAVDEQERFDFLDEFQELVSNLQFNEEDIVKICGDPILFLKYLKKQTARFLVVYPDEGTLRQLQEIAARKRMYDQMAFIRADDVGALNMITGLHVFDSKPEADIEILLKKDETIQPVWSGNQVDLIFKDMR